jgi:hypothetical protein
LADRPSGNPPAEGFRTYLQRSQVQRTQTLAEPRESTLECFAGATSTGRCSRAQNGQQAVGRGNQQESGIQQQFIEHSGSRGVGSKMGSDVRVGCEPIAPSFDGVGYVPQQFLRDSLLGILRRPATAEVVSHLLVIQPKHRSAVLKCFDNVSASVIE